MSAENYGPRDHYLAAMDSVYLINNLISKSSITEDEKDCIYRNVLHLKYTINKDIWTTEDLTPFYDAINAGEL